jgi:hypothetical protein
MHGTVITDQTVDGADVPPSTSTSLKGICVLGSHPQTKAQAPFDDPGWLIYACSPDNSPFGLSPQKSVPPRVDAWFEIHRPVFHETRPYRYLEWLSNIPVVYMRDQLAMKLQLPDGQKLFPTAVPYPEKEVKDRFGPFTFTSSIAFMMAKAILDIEKMREEGKFGSETPTLGLWGILQRSEQEYANQRQGTQNMIWNATKSGIKVLAAQQSGLFEPPPEIF